MKTIKINNIISMTFQILTFITIIIFFVINQLTSVVVFASDIQSSVFVTGTKKMLEDATNALTILSLIITILVVVYCLIRRVAADEMDYKIWTTRMKRAIICCIFVICMSIIVKIVSIYYN